MVIFAVIVLPRYRQVFLRQNVNVIITIVEAAFVGERKVEFSSTDPLLNPPFFDTKRPNMNVNVTTVVMGAVTARIRMVEVASIDLKLTQPIFETE